MSSLSCSASDATDAQKHVAKRVPLAVRELHCQVNDLLKTSLKPCPSLAIAVELFPYLVVELFIGEFMKRRTGWSVCVSDVIGKKQTLSFHANIEEFAFDVSSSMSYRKCVTCCEQGIQHYPEEREEEEVKTAKKAPIASFVFVDPGEGARFVHVRGEEVEHEIINLQTEAETP